MANDQSLTPSEPVIIDTKRLNKNQWIYFVLIFLLLLTEGMDGTLVSHVFPSLIKEWGVSIGGGIALVVSGGFLAMGIGAFIVGRFSDRWGRKPLLAISGLVMAIPTILGATSENFAAFTIWRFIACLGIGAVLPTAFTLVSELMPKSRRSAVLAGSYAGVGLGSALGATLAGMIIPTEGGWRALLILGGALSLAIVLIVWATIPESPSFLLSRGLVVRARRSVARIYPGRDLDTIGFAKTESPQKDNPQAFRQLLTKPFAMRTLLLWVFGFVSLGLLMLTNQYLPLLLQLPSPGLSTAESSTIVAIQGLGGVVGILMFSLVLLKRRYVPVIGTYLGISAILVSVVALVAHANFTSLLISLTAVALFMPAVLGPTRNILAVEIYPESMRATGVGATEFSARIGSASQGALGGILIGGGLGITGFFFALLVPLGILGAVLAGIRVISRRQGQPAELETLKDTVPPTQSVVE